MSLLPQLDVQSMNAVLFNFFGQNGHIFVHLMNHMCDISDAKCLLLCILGIICNVG